MLVRDLLDRYRAAAAVAEITFVSIDGFRSSVDVAGLRGYRVLLAIAADDRPISRASGGPIFLVFPHTETPATVALYPDRYWSFYVTDVIVGTEPARLAVGERGFDAALVDRITCPIGLPGIAGKEPEVIALSSDNISPDGIVHYVYFASTGMRPGDLIITRGGGHVAIHLGDNKIIHAPYAGEVVKIQKNYSTDRTIDTIRRIVRLADLSAETSVLEVGPGLGSLTLGLLTAGHQVTAVELDEMPPVPSSVPRPQQRTVPSPSTAQVWA